VWALKRSRERVELVVTMPRARKRPCGSDQASVAGWLMGRMEVRARGGNAHSGSLLVGEEIGGE
jgi:hypothetical protein